MSLRKMASADAPHAIYKAGEWTWKILKVNQPKKSPRERYSTWMVSAQSPNTFGGWDMGDTYCHEVMNFGVREYATPEFEDYLAEHMT